MRLRTIWLARYPGVSRVLRSGARGVVEGVDGNVRGDALREQGIDEATRVITLVAADTLGPKSFAPSPVQ